MDAEIVDSIQKRIQEIEAIFTRQNTGTKALLEEYGELQTVFRQKRGYSIESDAEIVMNGVGLVGEMGLETTISKLSGGEKTKLFLAQALISDADLLLLDEPSNHLDPDSVAWLSNYLRNYKGAMLVISHQHRFLDVFAEKVIEISLEDRGAYTYTGDFSNYLEQKARRDLEREKKAKRTEIEIVRLKEVADRLRAGDRSKTSKDRQKKIERIQSERPTRKRRERVIQTVFEVDAQSGYEVLKTSGSFTPLGCNTFTPPED